MKTDINPTVAFLRSEHAVASRVGTETVLLHLENGTYYGLDSVGTRVWDLLQESSTLDGICDVLQKEYAVSKNVLLNDIGGYFRELAAQDLIHTRQD